MAGFSKGFTQEKLASIADGLVVALAVSLPWSTSVTSILAVSWLLALIPTLHWTDIRREVSALAGGLPVLLVVLGVVGMLWTDVTLLERWKGLEFIFKIAGYTAVVRPVPPIWKQRVGVRGLSGFVHRIAGRDGHSHGDTVSIYADS